MREYEVTVVLKPDIDDDARNDVLERVEGWLTPAGEGEHELVKEHWGQKILAYPINKYTEGYYVHYNAELSPESVHEVERNIRFVDGILRHLVVRKPE